MTLSNKLIDSKIVEFSYDIKYNCPVSNLSSCFEKYCNCSYIDNFKIKTINYNSLINYIFSFFYPKNKINSRIFKIVSILGNISKKSEYYIIERLCSIYNIWDKKSYIPNIYNGYYGVETNGIFIKKDIADTIEYHFNKIQQIESLVERIYYILKLEYGSVLEVLENKNICLEKIENSKVEIFNNNYLNKIVQENIKYNSSPNTYISGMLVKQYDKYILIDGYHRFINNKNKKSLYLVFNEK